VEFEQRGVAGSATVEFYIDESGAVRMPAVFKADFPELGHLLADAVRQWKFDPPTRQGRPVLVHASQTVVFGKSD
jgi:TonB family protein